jgi:hypothetical protein
MKRILLFFMAAAALCGCSKNDPTEKPEVEKPDVDKPAEQVRIPITLSTDIWTKATDSGYESGDKVGIYTVNNVNGAAGTLADSGNHLDNTKFTFDGSAWNPDTPVYWKDETTPADFYCYYPYMQAVGDVTAVPFSVKADQSTLENYKASELLWGKKEGAKPSTDPVNISTRHAMSNLLVYVKPGTGYTEETLAAEGISVKVTGLKTSAKLNLATGVVTAEGASADMIPYKDNSYWRALVVPQDVVGTELIKVTVGDREYTLVQTVSFQSNKQHKCTVVIKRIGEGVNIGIEGGETADTDYGETLE